MLVDVLITCHHVRFEVIMTCSLISSNKIFDFVVVFMFLKFRLIKIGKNYNNKNPSTQNISKTRFCLSVISFPPYSLALSPC